MMTFVQNETAFPFKNYLDSPHNFGGYKNKSSTIIFKMKSPVFMLRG